jgi:hypothetical protein
MTSIGFISTLILTRETKQHISNALNDIDEPTHALSFSEVKQLRFATILMLFEDPSIQLSNCRQQRVD